MTNQKLVIKFESNNKDIVREVTDALVDGFTAMPGVLSAGVRPESGTDDKHSLEVTFATPQAECGPRTPQSQQEST